MTGPKTLVLAALLYLLVPSAAALAGGNVGTAYCFGIGCPCANDFPTAGCLNSSGQGTLLVATGSASVAADDLDFTGTQMPTNSVSIVIASTTQAQIPFRDGLLCLGASTLTRLQVHKNSGQQGTVTFTSIVGGFAAQNQPIQVGASWNFQIWHRDAGNGSPCGTKANTSNGLAITFEP